MRLACVFVLTGAIASLAACGAAEPPTYQLTQSKSAVRAAEEVGASDTPQAALHLKMAKDHIRRAQILMDDEENEEARWALRRAEADAELAIALAKEAEQHEAAVEARRKVEELKEQSE